MPSDMEGILDSLTSLPAVYSTFADNKPKMLPITPKTRLVNTLRAKKLFSKASREGSGINGSGPAI